MKRLALLPQRSTPGFGSESDRLLVVEALRLAASHWNATAHALVKNHWRQTAPTAVATQCELRAIDALRLADQIEKG